MTEPAASARLLDVRNLRVALSRARTALRACIEGKLEEGAA